MAKLRLCRSCSSSESVEPPEAQPELTDPGVCLKIEGVGVAEYFCCCDDEEAGPPVERVGTWRFTPPAESTDRKSSDVVESPESRRKEDEVEFCRMYCNYEEMVRLDY